ncbi:MAG: hypothetical protein ACE15B_00720 [Bryobacteraceae bacterium]
MTLSRREFLAAAGAAAAPRENARRLLLDSRVIERATGAKLVPGTLKKEPRPLFVEDKPWEPRFDNLYANVLYDPRDRLYKCWYSPFIVDPMTANTPRERRKEVKWHVSANPQLEMGICYATSRDGLNWRKPELGLVEFNGSRANNLILRADAENGEPHGAGIALDPRDPDPSRRYKLVFNWFHRKVPRTDPRYRCMCVGFSPDGLRWDIRPAREMQAPGDTHNNWFWSPARNAYVCITRLVEDQRLVARSESPDFLHWSKAEVILRGELQRQTYAMPSFRHGNVYLGLLMLLNRNGRYDTVDCELAWSPDTLRWERIAPGTPFIPRGPEGSHDSKCIFGAFHPVVLDEEIRVYYGGNNGEHTDFRDGFFCLGRLRPDGFAAMTPESGAPAEIVTRPLAVGAALKVNAEAAGGALTAAVIDGENRTLAESEPLRGDAVSAALRWKTRGGLAALRGRTARLRFRLERSRLYSFEFSV